VASWLLAPGLFHRRVTESGADVVTEPLGSHARVADLVLAATPKPVAVHGGLERHMSTTGW